MHIDPPQEYYWTPAKRPSQPPTNRKAQLHRTLLVFDSSVNRVKDS